MSELTAIAAAKRLEDRHLQTYTDLREVRNAISNASSVTDLKVDDDSPSPRKKVPQSALQRPSSARSRIPRCASVTKKKVEPPPEPELVPPKITRMAQNLQRSDTHEILYAKAGEYNAHKTILRERKQAQEVDEIRDPVINPASKAMVERSGSFSERLEDSQRHRQLHIAMLKENAVRQAVDEHTLQPAINPASKRLQRSVDQLIEWGMHRADRLEQARAEKEAAAQPQGKPRILKRSAMLAEKKMANAPRKVEDRLYAVAKKKVAEKEDPKPAISIQAAHTMVASDVSNRLYEDAKRLRQRAKEREEQLAQEQTQVHRLVSPRRPRSVAGERIEDILIRSGEERRARLDRKRREEERAESVTPARPRVNSTSEMLFQSTERAHTPLIERLNEPIRHVKQGIVEDVQKIAKQYTFKPETNKLSELLDQRASSNSRRPPSSRVERLMDSREEYERQMEAKRLDKEAQEMSECSFKPKLANRRLVLNGNIFGDRSPSTTLISPLHESKRPEPRDQPYSEPRRASSVFDRQNNWRANADRRVRARRAEAETNTMRECTFSPVLVASPVRRGSTAGRTPSSAGSATSERSPRSPKARPTPSHPARNHIPGSSREDRASVHSLVAPERRVAEDSVSRTLSIVDSILAREEL
ncbi:hypothetical protein J8273_7150 [Carpediemonas membranifera]|uniref:Uncharacterized protein n=1 Tax=Carpediemonas membranifera TaxID=201153 RepID=A0A8J6AT79_9EUKA|nr:hypothetical protein J8273_7150 [Carpediemonas membranifera]|eukprot:KAG9390885.1 hypothetical protein J8273_7150 [Carpediemonas membranifera]